MKSIHIGTFAGIPVKVHWTFGLFVLFVASYGYMSNIRGLDLLLFGGLIASMFVCVILHEYGHALSAKRYDVDTIDIIISPIGGLARLEKLPEKPIQELIVAIAGPLVNLTIATVMFAVLFMIHQDLSFMQSVDDFESIKTAKGFFGILVWINIVLFVFNLIPAFPMDGGRILRAGLSMKYGRIKGTKFASILGRILAIGFIAYAVLTREYMLMFVGIFVFVMAGNENKQVEVEGILSKATAADLMNPNFSKIHISEPLDTMFQSFLRGGERNYLVFDTMGNLSGILPELFLKRAHKEGILETTTANEYMSDNILILPSNISLRDLFEKMNKAGVSIAVIKDEDDILGVIDRHMLQNYIQVYRVEG